MTQLERLKQLRSRIKQGFTVERLRTFKGFENITDELGKQTIEAMKKYCSIVVRHLNRQKNQSL